MEESILNRLKAVSKNLEQLKGMNISSFSVEDYAEYRAKFIKDVEQSGLLPIFLKVFGKNPEEYFTDHANATKETVIKDITAYLETQGFQI